MPKFKNTRTGLIVNVPDQPQTRQARPKRDRQWSDKINRMDRSRRWERVPHNTPAPRPSDS